MPVEVIIESGLGLRRAFEDLQRKLEMNDVLRATYVQTRKICADISLDRPEAEGRLCFTLAHEVGHWVMHRGFVDLALGWCAAKPDGGMTETIKKTS
jgi:hypothetical protein